MSKKLRKSRHRIPPVALEPKSDPIDPGYQARVDASTNRGEAARAASDRRIRGELRKRGRR